MRTALLLLAAAFLLAQDYEGPEKVLTRVPVKARAKRNPVQNDPQASLSGRKLFEQHCAECHGASANGSPRGPGLNGPFLDQASEGDMFWIVSNGVLRRGMPSWSKLPEAQRWQIVTFLNSLKTVP